MLLLAVVAGLGDIVPVFVSLVGKFVVVSSESFIDACLLLLFLRLFFLYSLILVPVLLGLVLLLLLLLMLLFENCLSMLESSIGDCASCGWFK